jgi:hypothetical protein
MKFGRRSSVVRTRAQPGTPARARRGTPPDDMTLAIFKAFGANPVLDMPAAVLLLGPLFATTGHVIGMVSFSLETKNSTLH